jgi:dienelactone hydrolase
MQAVNAMTERRAQFTPINRRTMLGSLAAAAYVPRILRGAESPERPDIPWLAEVQTPPRDLPADASRLKPLLVDDAGQLIRTVQAWESRREQIRRKWLDFLHVMPCPATTPALTVLEEDRLEGVIRRLVRYEVEEGMPTEAYLLKPAESSPRSRPGVVAFHSTTNCTIRQPAGVEDRPATWFGLNLARRGFVAFCPRNFLWPRTRGEHEGAAAAARMQSRHPGVKGMAKMLYDAMRAVDVLVSQPEVSAGQIAAVGHSLGAKEVLYLAAFDPRVRVAVSSEGGIGTRFSNWEAPWYLGLEIKDPTFAREHHELLALAAPRAFLLLGGDSADGVQSWPFIQSALEVYRLYGGRPTLGLLNHHQGHSVPPEAEERIYSWIETLT